MAGDIRCKVCASAIDSIADVSHEAEVCWACYKREISPKVGALQGWLYESYNIEEKDSSKIRDLLRVIAPARTNRTAKLDYLVQLLEQIKALDMHRGTLTQCNNTRNCALRNALEMDGFTMYHCRSSVPCSDATLHRITISRRIS